MNATLQLFLSIIKFFLLQATKNLENKKSFKWIVKLTAKFQKLSLLNIIIRLTQNVQISNERK